MSALLRVAAVVITNPERSRFVVQRKDETYRYPLALALFGGLVEPGENDMQAIEREIVEEMGVDSALTVADGLGRSVDVFHIGFTFVLFEAVIDDGALDLLAERPVFEGKGAEIVPREDLLSRDDWMPGLVVVLRGYLNRRSPRPTPDLRS